jgi:quercetin dioxygenase-like cupin family protein
MKINPTDLEWEYGKVKNFYGKTLLDKNNGGIKLVKVSEKAIYPIHQHPNKTEFIYILEGNPIITIGEEKIPGEKGEFFILPNSVIHAIENKNESNECLLLVGSIKE